MTTEPPKKKLKTTETAFVDLSDDALQLVASFSAPPDVYSLCLTNKSRFFGPNGVEKDHNKEKEDSGRGAHARDAVFATKMLRSSLLSSLDWVLRSKVNLALDKFLVPPGKGSVVLSGSTMVQACLGELFKGSSDIDIYCTPPAAPAVRSWLVKEAGMMMQGFMGDAVLAGFDDGSIPSKVHHTEAYCLVPANGVSQVGPGENPFDYQEACAAGGGIALLQYIQRDWSGQSENNVPDSQNPIYQVVPQAGDPFPFWPQSSGNGGFATLVDLVVAKSSCTSPRQLLDDFDIRICSASWDGHTFCIPDPHLTFTKRTRVHPDLKALVEGLVHHANAVPAARPSDVTHIMQLVLDGLPPDSPYKHYSGSRALLGGSVLKTVDRIRKYLGHGVMFVDLDI